MNRLAWTIRQAPGRWQATIGLALLLLVAAAHVSVVRVLEQRLETVQAATVRAATRAPRDESPRQQLERFYRHFRESDPLPIQLAKLDSIARDQGLALRRGEYRLVDEPDGTMQRYQITLPVQGPYPAVRKFVARALDEIPVAALDQVLFERKRIGEGMVEAQVHFTLFVAKP